MGWLGWSPAIALEADVNCVIMAIEAKADLLIMVHGDGKAAADRGGKGKKGKNNRKRAAEKFKAFAARNQARPETE